MFKAVKAACELPDHEERRKLVRALTDSLINFNHPMFIYENDKRESTQGKGSVGGPT